MKHDFTGKLLKWYKTSNERKMPWKGEKDPYKIWLSEIILQQTRVEQGWKYYESFISRFPTITHLAVAEDAKVFKLWEGLGYYNRCKNLLYSARYIVTELDAKFPNKFEDILKLKGVGPYTAAAISSFAYGLPHAVVDGNVFRVLARYFGITIPIDSNQGKKHFAQIAHTLLEKKDSATYNQAIMDFGATICKPQIPICQHCIMKPECVAFNTSQVNNLPVKEKRLVRRTRWLSYFVFNSGKYLLIHKRSSKDIWQSLYEFYLFESETQKTWDKNIIQKWMTDQLGISIFQIIKVSSGYKQQLTHQTIHAQFVSITLPSIPESLKHLEKVKQTNLQNVAFPKIINVYLNEQL